MLTITQQRPLSQLTTLQLGGSVEYYVEATDRQTLMEALRWAQAKGQPVHVLGGGSNLLVADQGVPGLVVHMATRGFEIVRSGDYALVTAQAGESFQGVIDRVLAENLAGLECLTGIPGLVGATPIQNVGAYGQEVSDTIEAVEVLDRHDLATRWMSAAACGFGYRDSQFKRVAERYLVLAVRYRLAVGGAPKVAYPELVRALATRHAQPGLRQVADVVWALRASKSMVLDPQDENGRSAGSFFTNPIVSSVEADRVCQQAVAQGLVNHVDDVPCYPAGAGRKKLAAGFLIERAGIHKGLRRGAVGVSTRHALSLVHHGGGSTAALLSLASEIQQRVLTLFGIRLALEPVRWGETAHTSK